MPLKSCHWFLIRNPGGKEFWICSQCGRSFKSSDSPLFFVVKTEQETGMVFKCPERDGFFVMHLLVKGCKQPQSTTFTLGLPGLGLGLGSGNQSYLDDGTRRPGNPRDTGVRRLGWSSVCSAGKSNGRDHVTAKSEAFEKWPQGTLVCKDEKLSLRGFGQIFGAH